MSHDLGLGEKLDVVRSSGSQQHYLTLSHMGTDLFNWFGMDLVPLLFRTTPSGSRVQLGLRAAATKARTMLREPEDVTTRL